MLFGSIPFHGLDGLLCRAAGCWRVLLLPICCIFLLPCCAFALQKQPCQLSLQASRVFLNLTACLFLHVWIRPCMGTLSTPVPCPARAVTGTKTGCQLAGRLCSSAGTQGHSTHAAIPMLLLALGEHWGCCLPRVWVVVGAARARLGGLKSYGASCCGNPHHPRLLPSSHELQHQVRSTWGLACTSCGISDGIAGIPQ